TMAVIAPAQTITYGPVVANVSHSTARIVFMTSAAVSSASVQWGKTEAFGATKAAKRSGTIASVVLTGLEPETTYYVRAKGGSAVSETITFTTKRQSIVSNITAPEPVDVSVPAGSYNSDL